MISFFANLFGYILNFLYNLVGNYGLAIILFSVLVKLIMLPISIKQQKTMSKSQKINQEMKQIQFKYKNDSEKMNQEIMALYKREKMSPFSGCFSAIVQIVLLFAVFYLVRSPLTYMKKVDSTVIQKFEEIIQSDGNSSNYKEIAVIDYINKLKSGESVSVEEKQEVQNNDEENSKDQINQEQGNEVKEEDKNDFNVNDYIDTMYVNMKFLGLDLSKVPTEDLTNWKVFIIPVLYVISSFISLRLTTNMQNSNKEKDNLIGDGSEGQNDNNPSLDAMMEANNKSMSWFMPLMSISIALIAPLGLALYWLVNNMLMIIERIVLKKVIKDNDNEEEARQDA